MAIRRFSSAVFAYFAVVGAWTTAAAEEPGPALAANGSADEARQQLAAPDAAGQFSSPRSRYRKLNGQWWYWLPNHQWAAWDGKTWKVPSPKASDYQEWRQRQFADRYSNSAAEDDAMRRRDVDRWRKQSSGQSVASTGRADADYHGQIGRLHDTLMITPYDYHIGEAGHGLFEANPDRVIGNSGRMNYATSNGGYMGGALRSPYGY